MTGRILHPMRPCGSRRACRRCSTAWASGVLDYYAALWAQLPQVWHAHLSTADWAKSRDRLQTRAKRARSQYLLLCRDGEAHLFAGLDLPGTSDPRGLGAVEPDWALSLLQEGLRLPALRLRVGYSQTGDWTLPTITRTRARAEAKPDPGGGRGSGEEGEGSAVSAPDDGRPAAANWGWRTAQGMREAQEAAWRSLRPDLCEEGSDYTQPPPGCQPEQYIAAITRILAAQACIAPPHEEDEDDD